MTPCPEVAFLLEQIARVQRFATAMNNEGDRKRFEKMALIARFEGLPDALS
jgi:hypothetical protein